MTFSRLSSLISLALFFTFFTLFTRLASLPSVAFGAPMNAGFPLTSADELITDPQIKHEREIGRKAVEQIEERWEMTADPALIARLSMIAENLKPHMKREIPYEVRVIRSDMANAFCLPGGFVFFTTRMLELLHSDAEIAAVMAHEMIHVDQAHSVKMAAKANRVNLAALAAIILSRGALAPTVLAEVAQVAVNSAYTIEFEKEADSLGLDALIAAGYPPAAMVTLMEGFMREEIKQPVREYGIYMDHPESMERVHSMSEKLRSLRIPIERKIPLHLLRTSIKKDGGEVSLMIDDVKVWGGRDGVCVRQAVEDARKMLDSDFQMELAPYDLRLEGSGLRLKNGILAKTPLPDGMDSLPSFRENLLAALARAQSKHPIARYFR